MWCEMGNASDILSVNFVWCKHFIFKHLCIWYDYPSYFIRAHGYCCLFMFYIRLLSFTQVIQCSVGWLLE